MSGECIHYLKVGHIAEMQHHLIQQRYSTYLGFTQQLAATSTRHFPPSDWRSMDISSKPQRLSRCCGNPSSQTILPDSNNPWSPRSASTWFRLFVLTRKLKIVSNKLAACMYVHKKSPLDLYAGTFQTVYIHTTL